MAAILALPIAAGTIIGGAYIASDNSGSNTLLSLFPAPEVIISTFSPSEPTDLASFDETVDDEIKIEFVDPTPKPEEPVVVAKNKRKVNLLQEKLWQKPVGPDARHHGSKSLDNSS